MKALLRRLFTTLRTVPLISILILAGTPSVGTTMSEADPALAGNGMPLQFTSGGYVLAFDEESVIIAAPSHMVRTEFVGPNVVSPHADDHIDAETNSNSAPPLGRVNYPGLWDGISLVYEASEGAIVKSTYYLDDGKAVESIRLRYNRPLALDEDGNLLIAFDAGTMVEGAPIAWQETEGRRNPVEVYYILHGERELGFSLGDYLASVPLVIDPWMTFLGGIGWDVGLGIAVDGSGNVFVTGYSNDTWGSPLRSYTSDYDAFAAKLNSSGALQWHTFLGGSGGDFGRGIAVDGNGNVFVTGSSDAAWGSPLRSYTSDYDAFAAKLNSSGALQWHTFLGGSGGDFGRGIAVDGSGNVYVVGYSDTTWGSPIQAYTSDYDAFAAKLDSSGALQWHTFLGGSGRDVSNGIAVDSSSNVYVVGYSDTTWGSPIRAYTSGEDAFAAKLDSSGALQWHTFLGGVGWDVAHGIAVDCSGNVYVAGYSDAAWGSPLLSYASADDAFAAKLDSSGALQWHTFLGGSGRDVSNGIAVDSSSNVYVAGYSTFTWGSPLRSYASYYDAFAAKLNSSGALQWHTFLGGSEGDYGHGIAVDNSGNVHMAGKSSAEWGDFPVQPYYTSGLNAFVAKLDSNGNLTTLPTNNGKGWIIGLLAGVGIAITLAAARFFVIKKGKIERKHLISGP